MNEKALFSLSYGLYIVGAKDGNRDVGCIVNTAMQITAEPIKISTTVSKSNYTYEILKKTGLYTISSLTEETSMNEIAKFGFKSGRDIDKFEGTEFDRDKNGIAYIKNNCAAYLSCEIVDAVDVGSHTIFIANVIDGEILCNKTPMTYSYYHTVKKGTAPKAAPTYVKPQEETGWQCSYCGYVYEGNDIPDDYICPICNKTREFFEKA